MSDLTKQQKLALVKGLRISIKEIDKKIDRAENALTKLLNERKEYTDLIEQITGVKFELPVKLPIKSTATKTTKTVPPEGIEVGPGIRIDKRKGPGFVDPHSRSDAMPASDGDLVIRKD